MKVTKKLTDQGHIVIEVMDLPTFPVENVRFEGQGYQSSDPDRLADENLQYITWGGLRWYIGNTPAGKSTSIYDSATAEQIAAAILTRHECFCNQLRDYINRHDNKIAEVLTKAETLALVTENSQLYYRNKAGQITKLDI